MPQDAAAQHRHRIGMNVQAHQVLPKVQSPLKMRPHIPDHPFPVKHRRHENEEVDHGNSNGGLDYGTDGRADIRFRTPNQDSVVLGHDHRRAC